MKVNIMGEISTKIFKHLPPEGTYARIVVDRHNDQNRSIDNYQG